MITEYLMKSEANRIKQQSNRTSTSRRQSKDSKSQKISTMTLKHLKDVSFGNEDSMLNCKNNIDINASLVGAKRDSYCDSIVEADSSLEHHWQTDRKSLISL